MDSTPKSPLIFVAPEEKDRRGQPGACIVVGLSRDEVSRILKAPGNLKHQALLAIIYGSGLRVSEAVRLRAEHIESKRMLVRIEQSKGRKDRYTILSKSCLDLLREYWRTYQPGEWLFFAKDKNRPMPSETAQKIYHLAKQKAGVTRGRGIHTLRHYAEFLTMPSQ